MKPVAARDDHMILLYMKLVSIMIIDDIRDGLIVNCRIKDAGIRCPTVYHINHHVLVMDFIGIFDVYL